MNEFIIKNGLIVNGGTSTISGSLIAPSITGSLLGTASFASTSPITIGTTPITSGVAGRVLFEGAGNVVQEDSAFFWDNTNKRLGIGTSSPRDIINAVAGNSDFRFSQGASNVTPTIAAINTNSIGKAVGLVAGTNGSAFAYDNTGFFAIVGEAKSAFTSNTIGNGTIYLRAETDGKISIGSTAAQARLDVRAQGALSTDIAFRVRNSADTYNIISTRGDGIIDIRNSANSLCIGGAGTAAGAAVIVSYPGGTSTAGLRSVAVGGDNNAGSDGVAIGYNVKVQTAGDGGVGVGQYISGGGLSFGKTITCEGSTAIGSSLTIGGSGATNNRVIAIGRGMTETSGNAKMPHTFMFGSYATTGNKAGLSFRSNNINHLLLGYDIMSASYSNTTGTNWVGIANGTPPSGSIDAFQQYSADITAGNASPHFRTEAGNIVKLYTQAAVTSSQGIADVLTNLGFLTTGSSIATAYERLSDFQSPYHYSGNATLGTSTSSTTWIINRIDFTTPGSPITLQGTGSWDNRTSLIYL